jgi:hypothetical protein
MRGRFRIIITAALLLAAPAAALAQPARTEAAPCAPAHEKWSTQEQFAWARICGDEVADLAKQPGSQGVIDPRETALPDNRVLSKQFIETILTEDKYRSALKRHGIRITGARFKEQFDLQNVKLEVELWFEQCQFDDGVDLSFLQSSQPVAFNHSKVTKSLKFYAAQLASDLWVQGSVVDGISMVGAHVGRTLNLSNVKIASTDDDTLDLSGIDVTTDVLMNEGLYQTANLAGAHVGHTLSMAKSRFSGEINLRYSQIGGELDWQGATFMEDVDMTAARVDGALLIGPQSRDAAETGERCDRQKPLPQSDRPTCWAPEVAMTARYAKIGIIPRLSDAWPPELHVVGLTYDGIAYGDSRSDDDDIADVRDDFPDWFDRQGHSRQPYEQLATVLQARGEIETATMVRYAERERDRDRAWDDSRYDIYGWLSLLKTLIGYGYYPYRAVWWVLGFVLLGMGVLWVSGEGRRNGMPVGASYSFDMLLPIIQLRPRHYEVDLAGWPRYYFYIHKIIGWALASFLIAGLAGLTK